MKPTVIVGLAVIVVGAVVYFQIRPAQVFPPVTVSEDVTRPVTVAPEEVATDQVEEDVETAEEPTVVETVEGTAEGGGDGAAQANTEDTTEALGSGASAESVANILTPEGFNADEILEMINASDLGALQKTALNTAVIQARDNPELVQVALDQVKAALGL